MDKPLVRTVTQVMSLSRITTWPTWSMQLSEINNIMYAVKIHSISVWHSVQDVALPFQNANTSSTVCCWARRQLHCHIDLWICLQRWKLLNESREICDDKISRLYKFQTQRHAPFEFNLKFDEANSVKWNSSPFTNSLVICSFAFHYGSCLFVVSVRYCLFVFFVLFFLFLLRVVANKLPLY